jgi:hypothetical protein
MHFLLLAISQLALFFVFDFRFEFAALTAHKSAKTSNSRNANVSINKATTLELCVSSSTTKQMRSLNQTADISD